MSAFFLSALSKLCSGMLLVFLAVVASMHISVATHAAPLGSGRSVSVRIANLGANLELRETAAPADLPSHAGLRYFTTPDGAVVAMANRLLVVVSDQSVVDRIADLQPVLAHATLADVGKTRIELLQTADVNSAIALLGTLTSMRGVLSVQPDLSQNVVRQDDGRFDWQRFDLAGAIGLRDAWRLTLGQGVRVAIIDTGIDLKHRDLHDVKLLASFDIDRGSNVVAPEDGRENHGTRVAGLIFASHNGFGVDGIAPRAGLIAVRLMSGWTSTLVAALQAAAQAGADVINCSWTFPLMLDPVARLVDEFASSGRNGHGVLLIIAAGNRPVDIVRREQFPAYPALLAVTSVDHHGVPYGAAYGSGVFIAAPGMLKTTTNRVRDGFEPLGSTSAAAAVVSGVAALMLAVNPQLDRAQVLKLLADTADRSPPGDFAHGRSRLLGVGRVHAGRAVTAAAAARTKAPL